MWNLLKTLAASIGMRFSRRNRRPNTGEARTLPGVWFDRATVVEKTPSNAAVVEKHFVVVRYKDKFLWALFKCPCRCGEVVSLPLQAPHSPRWSVSINNAGRPSLYPSVWRNKACMSHFWIEDGRVFWTLDTGMAPWIAKPTLYHRQDRRDGLDV
ncbi:DUF6527 family protein [Bradyrhizobium ivorense]|uniref:DUF6527 family protein n=1 Tax=Bradyrhizobium ivorense TaxID=2511166 RepID=UPI003D31FE97